MYSIRKDRYGYKLRVNGKNVPLKSIEHIKELILLIPQGWDNEEMIKVKEYYDGKGKAIKWIARPTSVKLS